MVTEQILYTIGSASWSSIFAGAAAALAISIIMAVLGVALGFSVVNPKSDEPASGLGVAFGLWSFLSIVVSMAAGGFIAGFFSGQRGPEHGFMVWAVVTIAATFFSSIAVSTAVKSIGSAVKAMGSGAAGAAGAVGKGAAEIASGAIQELRENVHLDLDTDKLSDAIVGTLRDTGVDTLQPEYLQRQMREARSDLRTSLYHISLKPADAENIIGAFLDKERKRLESLTQDLDKDAAIRALMAKRSIPREEAAQLVDNAVSAYDLTVQKARECLAEAKEQVRDARVYLKEMGEQARDKAARAASFAARTALAATAALVLAAAISVGAGMWGAGATTEWYAVQSSYSLR